jgi:Flp pilus assembly protein TadD
MRQQALDALKKAAALSPDSVEIQAQLGWAYARNGQASEANQTLSKLLLQSDQYAVTAYEIAMIYNALGNKTATMTWLQQARTQHSYPVSSISIDARVDNLRSDPDFEAMIRDMHYPGK